MLFLLRRVREGIKTHYNEKYSKEARELLSDFELYEVKAGGPGKGDGSEKPCTACTTCVACSSTCVACSSMLADVLDAEKQI